MHNSSFTDKNSRTTVNVTCCHLEGNETYISSVSLLVCSGPANAV